MPVVQSPTPKLTAAVLTESITFANPVTDGNLLICWARAGGINTGAIADDLGDGVPWTAITPAFGGSNDKMAWAKIAGATGPCTVTVTGTPSGTIRLLCREYSGYTATLDQAVVTAVNLTNTVQSVGPTAAIQQGCLVVCGHCSGIASIVVSAGAAEPYDDLLKLDNNANGSIAVEDDLNWPGGAATGTFGMAPTSTSDMFIAAFEPVDATIAVQAGGRGRFGPF